MTVRGRPLVRAIAVLACLSVARLHAQEPPQWTLVDVAGAPVAGARVSVEGRTGSVLTSPEGAFQLQPVPVPPFVLVVLDAAGAFRGSIRIEEVGAGPRRLVLPPPLEERQVVQESVAPSTIAPPAAAATSVTRQAIEERRPTRLAAVLEGIPGAGVLEGGESAVPSLRGLARGRTLILLDDARVTAERRAGPSATFLDPFSLESMEVVRGPGSVAYGSDALGGVLHARTPRPRPGELGGRFEAAAGTSGEWSGGLEGNVPLGTKGALLLQGRLRRFDGYDSPHGEVADATGRDHGFLVRAGLPAGDVLLQIGFQADRGRDMGKPSLDTPEVRTLYPEEASDRLTFGLDLPPASGWSALEVRGFVGQSRLVTDRVTPGSGVDGQVARAEIDARDASLRAVGTRATGRGYLRLGVDLSGRFDLEAKNVAIDLDGGGRPEAAIEETAIASADRTDLGAFLEGELPGASGRFNWAAGMRTDRVRSRNRGGIFGDRRAERSGLAGYAAVTAFPSGRLRATAQVARGFREPSLSDRYFRGVTGRGFVTGNPDLGPETSLQWDLAVHATGNRVSASLYGYVYRIRDLIERYRTGSDFAFRNRGEEDLRGLELETELTLPASLRLRAALAVARGTILDDRSAPADVPPPSATLTVEHRPPGPWSAWGRLVAVARGERPGPTEIATPGYAVLGGGVSRDLRRDLTLRLALENVLDRAYPASADERAVLAPGRGAVVSLGGRF